MKLLIGYILFSPVVILYCLASFIREICTAIMQQMVKIDNGKLACWFWDNEYKGE